MPWSSEDTYLVYDTLAGVDQERFNLRTEPQGYKRKEAFNLWSPSVIATCSEASGKPLPQAEWASDNYALVRTTLKRMLNACEATVLAQLPVLLKE